jgi:single-strand DNA-binding protein
MSASITLKGFVATPPKFSVVGGDRKVDITSFRLGASDRRFNPSTERWENGDTSFYSVSCFGRLAVNAFASLNKGDAVVVTGRRKVKEWSAGEKSGLDVEVVAESVGHDLRWGKTGAFVRNTGSSSGGNRDVERDAGAVEVPDDSEDESDANGPDEGRNPLLSIASSLTLDAGEPAEETEELRTPF